MDQMTLLVRLSVLTWWHRLARRDHEPDYILLLYRWECRGCYFGTGRPLWRRS